MNIDNSVGKSPKDRAPLSAVAAAVAWTFIIPRDALARLLLKMRITPNGMTVLGVGLTGVAAGYLAKGASQGWSDDYPGSMPYPAIAGIWLFWVCGADMLDGAMARLGNKRTAIGAVLDSSLDRISDMVIFGAIALHFAARANITYCLLAIVALANAMMISYVKARSENLIPSCSVGFWQRGERMSAVLISAFSGHITVMLWLLATLPALTAGRRILFSIRQLEKMQGGKQPAQTDYIIGKGFWARLAFWRYPRGSRVYVMVCVVYMAIIIFVSIPDTDYLAKLLN